MNRRLLAIGGVGILVIALVAYLTVREREPLPFGANDVAAVWLDPVPEGPVSPKFTRDPKKGEMALSDIAEAIPSPLPRDVWQGFDCTMGGDVVVRLQNGDELRYGPCKRPPSIERLRKDVLDALDF